MGSSQYFLVKSFDSIQQILGTLCGFPRRIGRRHVIKRDMIIGVTDSGIWPKAESFYDEGLGPIPKKWKGKCESG